MSTPKRALLLLCAAFWAIGTNSHRPIYVVAGLGYFDILFLCSVPIVACIYRVKLRVDTFTIALAALVVVESSSELFAVHMGYKQDVAVLKIVRILYLIAVYQFSLRVVLSNGLEALNPLLWGIVVGGCGRVARPFGFALTDPYGRLSRIRLFAKVTPRQHVMTRAGE
jgi:hypothetical protein